MTAKYAAFHSIYCDCVALLIYFLSHCKQLNSLPQAHCLKLMHISLPSGVYSSCLSCRYVLSSYLSRYVHHWSSHHVKELSLPCSGINYSKAFVSGQNIPSLFSLLLNSILPTQKDQMQHLASSVIHTTYLHNYSLPAPDLPLACQPSIFLVVGVAFLWYHWGQKSCTFLSFRQWNRTPLLFSLMLSQSSLTMMVACYPWLSFQGLDWLRHGLDR